MIQVKIEDSFGNQLQLGDLVLVRYTSPLFFHIGVLAFRTKELQFVLATHPNVAGKWEGIDLSSDYRTYEKVADKKEWPIHYYNMLGYKDFHRKGLTPKQKKQVYEKAIAPIIEQFKNYQ